MMLRYEVYSLRRFIKFRIRFALANKPGHSRIKKIVYEKQRYTFLSRYAGYKKNTPDQSQARRITICYIKFVYETLQI